ncbi:MAG: S1 RNA-binding domain-containing protein [Candidatus Micrarchaeota archaeon]|nr:S1 RNA-binding domain-containing protein [Candidatus Micrarchaeota archaeon]MCX8154229.1 S1 RNA-binding domain-containing protein [Candidatus Micrarchaeota archaeon]
MDRYVIVRVTRIEEFGVYCEVLDHPGYQGFVSRGEVSSSWIKDISRLIRVGEIRGAKILNIDENSKVIELSFRRVSEKENAEMIQMYRNEQTALNILKNAVSKAKIKKGVDPVINLIKERYRSLYEFFRNASTDEKLLDELNIPKTLKNYLKEEISKRFGQIVYRIKVDVSATSGREDGLNSIKTLFSDVNAKYIGGGKYMIEFEHTNPKELRRYVETIMQNLSERAKDLEIDFEYQIRER